mgnify:CR=1 FL=1
MQIEFQFYWENARTNMNRVMKLKPSGGCRTFLAAFVATLASVAQLFAANAVITWDNPADIVYGTALSSTQLNASFTHSDTGAQLQGTTIYSPSDGTYLDAGNGQALTVTFTPNDAGLAQNTLTVFVNVAQAPLTATAASGTPQYGVAVANLKAQLILPINSNVTYSGFVNNGVITDDANEITVVPVLAVSADETTNAGSSKPVTFATSPVADNYNITTVNGTLTVTKKPLVFTLSDKTKVYGENPIPNDLDVQNDGDFGEAGFGRGNGWENNEETQVKVNQVHALTAENGVGSYDITVNLDQVQAGVLDNYDVQINNGSYTVVKRDVVINADKVLGGEQITYGVALPVFEPEYIIDTNAAPWDLAVATPGNPLVAVEGLFTTPETLNLPAADSDASAAPYDITTSGAVVFGGNFNLIRNNETLLVNKATLDVKAADRNKITGAQLPSLAVLFPDSANQLKHGDTVEAIFDPYPPALIYTTAAYGPPLSADLSDGPSLLQGTYDNAIIFDGVPVTTNYNIVTTNGKLVVTLQPAQVVWNPTSTTLTYGDALEADKHLNATTSTTYVDGAGTLQNLTGTVVYTTPDPNGNPVAINVNDTPGAGTYAVTATFTPTPGQFVEFADGTFTRNITVGKASLKVTADDQTRVFGAVAFNGNAVTYDGFLLGDDANDLGTAPTVADPTSAGSDVAEYPIIPSAGVSANYAFNYVSGKLAITQADTAVAWAPEAGDPAKAITYGTALNATANLNAAGPAGVAGAISYSVNTSDARALTVPTNDVIATFTPTSPNYKSSTLTATIHVVRREASVVPSGFDMVFGDTLPGISGTADEANGGFLDGDGIVTTFSTDAVQGSDVGVYFITAEYEDSLGRLRNYTIKLSSGEDNRINVTQATVNIETLNVSSGVGQAEKAGSLRLSGLKAEAAVLNGVELTVAQLTTAHGANELVIDVDTKYNNTDSGLPASVIGLDLLGRVFNGGKLPQIAVTGFANTVAAEFDINTVLDTDPVGGISVGDNYTLGVNTSGKYSVGKADPTITWANAAITYGVGIAAAQLNASVQEAPLNAVDKGGSYVYRVGDANGEPALGAMLDAGKHILHVTYTPHADNANAFNPKTATMELTVDPANLRVTIPAVSNYIYGDPLPNIALTELVYGDGNGNLGFVNGDDSSVFNPSNGGTQPVVAIKPGAGIVDGGFTVANSPAITFFGQMGDAKNYNVDFIEGTMAIARRPITVKAADTATTFGVSVPLGLEYTNLAPNETGDSLSNAGFAFLSGQADIATLAPQSYTIFANGAFGDNYTVTHATGTLVVGKAAATINVAGTAATYDGTAKSVTIETVPAGLATAVTYNGAAALPINAGTYSVAVDVSGASHSGALETTLVISPAAATVTLGDLAQNYDGTGKSASVTTDPAGVAVGLKYNNNPTAPTQAGSYGVEASVTDPNFTGSAAGTLVIGKGVAQIALSNLSQVANGSARAVGVSTSPAGLSTVVTYDGAATAPSAVGSYAVSVTVQSADYDGSVEGTLTILEAATINFDGLLATYTGDPLTPTITTTPAGLTVNVTYNKNPAAPHEAGTYEVVASIQDATYSGSEKAIFEITKSSTATITFVASSLQAPWNNVQAPQVTTDPAGLAVRMTYNGSLELPSTPGEYEVTAIINDRNVRGSATATFTIGKSAQDINFPAIPNLSISGNPVILVLSATSNSGLPVKYIVLRGGATVDGNLLTISQPGLVSLTAQQLGNENYLPADEEVRSFEVTGTGVPLGAAQTEASLNDDGSVSLGVSGSPFESLSIYSASVVDAEFKPIVKIVLDADGKGSYNTASDADQRFFQVK